MTITTDLIAQPPIDEPGGFPPSQLPNTNFPTPTPPAAAKTAFFTTNVIAAGVVGTLFGLILTYIF